MQAVKFVFFVCVNSLKMATSCCESTQQSVVAIPTWPTDVGRPPNYSYKTPGPLRYSGYATCLLCFWATKKVPAPTLHLMSARRLLTEKQCIVET